MTFVRIQFKSIQKLASSTCWVLTKVCNKTMQSHIGVMEAIWNIIFVELAIRLIRFIRDAQECWRQRHQVHMVKLFGFDAQLSDATRSLPLDETQLCDQVSVAISMKYFLPFDFVIFARLGTHQFTLANILADSHTISFFFRSIPIHHSIRSLFLCKNACFRFHITWISLFCLLLNRRQTGQSQQNSISKLIKNKWSKACVLEKQEKS